MEREGEVGARRDIARVHGAKPRNGEE